MKGGYYPDKAKRLGLEGRALVEFNIDADGQSKQLSIVFADDATFAHMATTIISGARFDVPTDWVASGHEEQRYRLGLVFCLPPSSQMDTFTETTDTVVIKGSRIPGSPIRHPPSPGTAGKCMQT
jgi:TonB family protein